MKVLFNKKFMQHNPNGLADGSYRIKKFPDKYPDTKIDFDPMPFIERVHTQKHIENFKYLCQTNGFMAEVSLSPESYECALLAAGLTIKASETGNFAVVRPPGHHASRDFAAGFCFFNNVAIATTKLVDEHKKVAILDIDGHRGDGTQSILKNEPHVLCISLHQKGAYGGDGEDFSDYNAINFALKPGTGHDDYLEAVNKALGLIHDFNPDVVAVTAGFDTYKKDKLLNFNLELKTYYEIGKLLGENFENVFAHLAGGYHNHILECVESFVDGINNS